jgi:hypothetical protein
MSFDKECLEVLVRATLLERTLAHLRRLVDPGPCAAWQVQAILIGQYTQCWGLYGLLSWMPSFFNKAFDVDVSNLAVFTVVPYLVQVRALTSETVSRFQGRCRATRCRVHH